MIARDPSVLVACVAIVAIAAVCDLATRRIPNLLTFGGIALGVFFHAAVGHAEAGIGGALRGLLLAASGVLFCSIIPALAFARGEMGGGDVKLFAAIGAMAGPSIGIDAQTFTFVFVLLVLWPWRLARSGGLRIVARGIWSKLLRRSADVAPVRVAPVVLGPSILLGLSLSLLRHGALA